MGLGAGPTTTFNQGHTVRVLQRESCLSGVCDKRICCLPARTEYISHGKDLGVGLLVRPSQGATSLSAHSGAQAGLV